jgi:hypothetical protein
MNPLSVYASFESVAVYGFKSVTIQDYYLIDDDFIAHAYSNFYWPSLEALQLNSYHNIVYPLFYFHNYSNKEYNYILMN